MANLSRLRPDSFTLALLGTIGATILPATVGMVILPLIPFH
jgi:hypothetical protein